MEILFQHQLREIKSRELQIMRAIYANDIPAKMSGSRRGKVVDFVVAESLTPLMLAARLGHAHIARLRLSKHADGFERDDQERSAAEHTDWSRTDA